MSGRARLHQRLKIATGMRRLLNGIFLTRSFVPGEDVGTVHAWPADAEGSCAA
jgi:hypothetical protein